MAFDSHKNLAQSTVISAPSPALSGTSLTVAGGQGALFPTAPFNCTVCPKGTSPTTTNAEIIRVTTVVGDVFTIVRAQEGTAARAILVTDKIWNSVSVKVFTDIETVVNALPTFAVQSLSAGGAAATGPQIVFSNSNSVSFGVAGNTITASFAAAAGGGAAISAGGNSQSTGTVIFSNSNGVTFGLAGGTLTASYTVPGATVFSNSNNVTFGLAGSTVTASASANAQTTQPVAASASNGSFLFSTLGFSNANGVTFGTSAGNIVTASVAAAVGQSVQPVAASASNGSFLFSTLGFSNGNGVTFGTSAGSIVTASVAAGVAQSTQPVAASASNGSFLFSTLAFSNGGGVTFGTSAGSIISASVSQSSAPLLVITAGNGSFSSASLSFSDSNGISFSTTAGGAIVASHNALTSQSNQAVSNSLGSFTFQTLNFSDANGVTFGTNAGGIVTASVAAAVGQTVQPVAASASNGSFLFSTLGFSNGNGVTFGTSAGSIISASVAAAVGQTVQPVAASASNGSFLFSTLGFSNANNITFGTSAGSIITASATVASTQDSVNFSAGTTSGNVSNIVFSNLNGISFGLDGSTITASAAAGTGAPAAAATLNYWSPFDWVGTLANGSPGQNSLYLEPMFLPAPVSMTRIGQPFRYRQVINTAGATTSGTHGATFKAAIYSRSVTNSTATNFSNSSVLASQFSTSWTISAGVTQSGNSITFAGGWGTGTINGGSSVGMTSLGVAFIQNQSFDANKILSCGAATFLTAGDYCFAQVWSTSSAGMADATNWMGLSHRMATVEQTDYANGYGAASNTTVGIIRWLGLYSTTTGAFPATISLSQINACTSSRHCIYLEA